MLKKSLRLIILGASIVLIYSWTKSSYKAQNKSAETAVGDEQNTRPQTRNFFENETNPQINPNTIKQQRTNNIAIPRTHSQLIVWLEKALSQDHQEALEEYLRRGGDPNLRLSDGSSLMASFIHHGQRHLLEMALQNKGNIEARDARGNSLLISAIMANQPDITETLLEHDASVNHTNDDGESPLSAATSTGDSITVGALLEHNAELPGSLDDLENHPLYRTVQNNDPTTAEVLFKHRPEVLKSEDKDGRHILFHACQTENHSMVAALIAAGVQRDHEDRFGHTAAEYARQQGYKKCADLIEAL